MGVSIFYEVGRDYPLTAAERTAIDEIIRAHPGGAGWEGFCVYARNEFTGPNVIFEGATRLPMSSEDEFWVAVQHWCRVLSLIRRVLADAVWSVHIDDHEIGWDEARNEYDPSR